MKFNVELKIDKLIDSHVHMGKTSAGGDLTVDQLLESMDRYNIEYSGLSILNGIETGPLNDKVIAAVNEHPDRIVGLCYLNPRDPYAIDELKRCMEHKGMRGIKFHSWKHGYYPDNNLALDKLIDEIEKYDVPILTHTGTPSLSLPQQWATVAKRHPNVKFIFAHIGYLDYGYGCVECARELPNVWVDTCGQVEIQVIEKALEVLGPDKIIWGTDWPYKYPGSEIAKFEPYNLSKEDQQKIFYDNIKKLWKL